MEVVSMKLSRVSLPLLLLALAGCGTGSDPVAPTSGTSADQSAIQQEMAQHPDLIDDEGISSSEAEIEADASASASASATLGVALDRPLRFGRHIRSIERRFEYAFADTDSTGRPTTARVTIHTFLAGTFNVAMGDSGTVDTVIHKPLHDHAIRHVRLKRVRLPGTRRDAWKIVATSGVEVTSRDAEVRIQSLRVQSGALDTTITDPLALFRLRAILKLTAGEPTTLTVTTNHDDDVVLLHTRLGRFPLHTNGDGTYSGTWTAPLLAGFRHAGINALSHGTLFDPAAPYDSQAWILPYRVTDQDPGEYAL
jgi:hypothetical protein